MKARNISVKKINHINILSPLSLFTNCFLQYYVFYKLEITVSRTKEIKKTSYVQGHLSVKRKDMITYNNNNNNKILLHQQIAYSLVYKVHYHK